MLSEILHNLEARHSSTHPLNQNPQPNPQNPNYSFPQNPQNPNPPKTPSKKNLLMTQDEMKSFIDFSTKDPKGNLPRPSTLNSRDAAKLREKESNESSVLGLDLNKPEILDLIKKDTGVKGHNLQ